MKILNRHLVESAPEIQKVFVITVCWVLVHSILFVHEYFSKIELIHLEKLSRTYEFWPDFMGTLFLNVLGGVIGGTILVFKRPVPAFQKSYAYDVIGSGLVFIICYLLIAALGAVVSRYFFFTLHWNTESFLDNFANNFIIQVKKPSFFIAMTVWGLLVSATRFMLHINDKFGQGVLWKFITGKYHCPKEEKRIFMFLDLKGATSIAEKMESSKFFGMLKDFYEDITDSIVESSGEIYQYVGDEIVISWPVNKGIRDNNALLCFFRIEKKLVEQRSKYIDKYGVVPSFKAGLHVGEATVGEIGIIKKEIVYSGDVLNTTSRIQALCNHYEVAILISSTLLQLMKLGSQFISIPIGEIGLRGKEQKISLNTVQPQYY